MRHPADDHGTAMYVYPGCIHLLASSGTVAMSRNYMYTTGESTFTTGTAILVIKGTL
uniref:Uncharacterized protein n=1 Tax=Setaria italica TaxID=4555 RepID=K3YBK8_SETIT